MEMYQNSNVQETPLTSNNPEREITKEIYKVPEPSITGNAQIEILDHNFVQRRTNDGNINKGIGISLKNVAEATIGKAVFQAVFYDIRGDVLDTVERTIEDIKKDEIRTVLVEFPKAEENDVKSYDIRLIKVITTPLPAVTDNDKVKILNHYLGEDKIDEYDKSHNSVIRLTIRNVSEEMIATAVFDATFYDSEGNVVDSVRRREEEIKSNTSRAIFIKSHGLKKGLVKSYKVELVKTITPNVEKIKLRRHEIRSLKPTGAEIRGSVKNISNEKTDAALVATFYDYQDEKIGMEVIHIRDVEPDSIKKTYFSFIPQNGEHLKTYTLDICDIVEQ
jgi:vacuolar-type H+-ATPase subunit I/STV1